jgi:hypothetical protein
MMRRIKKLKRVFLKKNNIYRKTIDRTKTTLEQVKI